MSEGKIFFGELSRNAGSGANATSNNTDQAQVMELSETVQLELQRKRYCFFVF